MSLKDFLIKKAAQLLMAKGFSSEDLIRPGDTIKEKNEWKNSLEKNSQFLMANGFEIVEETDEGMFKYARLKKGKFQLIYHYDRGFIDCRLVTSLGSLDLVGLVHYLNRNGPKNYLTETFKYLRDEPGQTMKDLEFATLKHIDQLVESEFGAINAFLDGLNKEKIREVHHLRRDFC